MIWIQIIAAELGLAVLLLTVIAVLEIFHMIDFRKRREDSGGLGQFFSIAAPPAEKPEEKEGDDENNGGGHYL